MAYAYLRRSALLILLCSYTAQAQKIYTFSRVFHATGSAFDIATTVRGNEYKELNPVVGQSAPRQVAVVCALGIVFDRLTNVLRVSHPKLATTLNFAAGSAHMAAGGWNLRLITK